MPIFQSKARTIDHLGKSQIADMPTAILELWKNGYDAYADNLSCDLFQIGSIGNTKEIMTISDDGIGMSEKDIFEKWLVIGTDSKTRGIEQLSSSERLGKEKRIKMGEKGIGRLSIAFLGSPMLMVTKKANEEPIFLLIDWKIFTNYNLYLHEINIPTIQSSQFTSAVETLKNTFLEDIDNGTWNEHIELLRSIKNSIKEITLQDKIKEELKNKFSDKNSHGTYCIIFEFDSEQIVGLTDTITYSSDNYSEEKASSEHLKTLKQSLSGMINPFEKSKKDIKTSFNVHGENISYDIVGKNSFFDYTDIDKCEHSIIGEFDEEGYFIGTVKVFGKVFSHTFRPNRVPGNTSYGKFNIKLGHIEGTESSSSMNSNLFHELTTKMKTFGGLYIYKNDFRILPYGRTEYDFLGFEQRRSLRAGTYMLSHRKMAGYIGLTTVNTGFREKSGREGFIDNKTYKDFKKDLIEFFIDCALKFYATKKDSIPDYEKTYRQLESGKIKAENERIAKLEKNKERKTKKNLKLKINKNKEYFQEIEDSLNILELKSNNLSNNLLLSLEEFEDVERNYNELKAQYSSLKIVGFGRVDLSDKEKENFEEYKTFEYKIENKLKIHNESLSKVRTRFQKDDLKLLLENKLEEKKKELNKVSLKLKKDFFNSLEDVKERYLKKEQNFFDNISNYLGGMGIDDISDIRTLNMAIDNINNVYNTEINSMYETSTPFIEHIKNLDTELDEDKLTGFYKIQYEEMKVKSESMYELSQLGMAVEIIDHQFNVLYSSITDNVEALKYNIPNNNNIALDNLNKLSLSVEHLENNHRLLTPLYRSNRRVKKEITGEKLIQYLNKFFSDKLSVNGKNILETNNEFLNHVFYTFPSVLNPVFINILNNALFWLNSTTHAERKILICKYNNEIVIENSGKKIDNFDLENVFKLFFSRRPSGRGIGLHLAKTNLETLDMEIYASNSYENQKLNGACFIIKLGSDHGSN